jgi:hypothetical protein
MTPIRARAAALLQYGYINPHRVDDPDAAPSQLALDSRDIYRGLSWISGLPRNWIV